VDVEMETSSNDIAEGTNRRSEVDMGEIEVSNEPNSSIDNIEVNTNDLD
jgi:hypothetical protein